VNHVKHIKTLFATMQSFYARWLPCGCAFKSLCPSGHPSTCETPGEPVNRSSETLMLLSFTKICQQALVITSDNIDGHCRKTHIRFCPHRESNSLNVYPSEKYF